MEYETACRLQEDLAAARVQEAIGDTLLLVQHPSVITVGRGGGWQDILAPAALLQGEGVRVLPTDRGGRATYHGPGQLVAYPILKLPDDDLHAYLWRLEEVVIRVLAGYGLTAGREEAHPGVWLSGSKIAAIGLAVRQGITRHGLALNVAPNMAHFRLLVPCGIAEHGVTSMAHELGRAVELEAVSRQFVAAFGQVFDCQVIWADSETLPLNGARGDTPDEEEDRGGQPRWLWRRVSPESEAAVARMADLLDGLALHTVCQEARCPNLAECFGRGTATFLILGDQCTRGCRFCAISHGRPAPPDPNEPQRVAEAAARLGLRHAVLTSVTRDDLSDGGAGHFAAAVQALRSRLPGVTVEVLIPDLGGSETALRAILDAQPDVLNHNVETVPRLYRTVRPGADYRRSLALLARAKALRPAVVTKSGLMLGLGERTAEVIQALHDLRGVGCDLLTLGQYLQPTEHQLPVARYVSPDEFTAYGEKARAMGFRGVASGPLVRSSHRAEALWAAALSSSAF
ncbi:MAG: lipoyl synthase [Anaerolineae bacterium]|nr:lipoyl synthase [Anaerolineae bacterium]